MVDDLITSWEYLAAILADCNIYCAQGRQEPNVGPGQLKCDGIVVL